MASALDLRGLEVPVVQAGMGAIARHELAAAVSDAGGLGTVAAVRSPILTELAAARTLTGRPLAINILLPFIRRADSEAAALADIVVTFWGVPRRLSAATWIHQCGSVAEAQSAAAAGADAVIAQGVEAGGHVRGTVPALELLERIRAAVRIPVLMAGGIVDRAGVTAALEAGAVAAVVGTRFLAARESRAHAEYKRRCVAADHTVLTELFGLGWPDARHRVIPNAATERWLRGDPRGPTWLRLANRYSARAVARVPGAVQASTLRRQRPWWPLLSPQPPTDDGPAGLLDAGPLYAGANVKAVTEILPAAQVLRALSP